MHFIDMYELSCFYLISEFTEHQTIKNDILKILDETKTESLTAVDEYYSDNISKLDWSNCHDFERDWVKRLLPSLNPFLDQLAFASGYKTCKINQIWFQQYLDKNMHGWHVHGSNFTGVYYLELDESSPKTELRDPYTQRNIITPDIKEGDILIFPSFCIHRAPVIHNDVRKTIISFNVDFEWINDSVLKE